MQLNADVDILSGLWQIAEKPVAIAKEILCAMAYRVPSTSTVSAASSYCFLDDGYGLSVLHPDPAGEEKELFAEYDAGFSHARAVSLKHRSIVFLHGLNGGRKHTWTHEESQSYWPLDFLAQDIPDVRIMTMGYGARAGVGRNSAATFRDYGIEVLAHVADARKSDKVRPLLVSFEPC